MKNQWSNKLVLKGWQLYGETKYAASAVGVSLVLMLTISPAIEAKIYRVVDENGKVSYTDTPPKAESVEEVDLPELTNSYDGEAIRERQRGLIKSLDARNEYQEKRRKESEASIEDLNAQLKQAEESLAQAKTIKEGDLLPLKGGGVRRSPAYLKRVEEAKLRVVELKKQLKNN